MGIIQSMFCSCAFCLERVLTFTCCAFLIMLLMFSIILLMVYGISVGYHYAQKELSAFAIKSQPTTKNPKLLRYDTEPPPVLRFLAVNRSEIEQPPRPQFGVYRRQGPKNLFLDKSKTPVVLLQTEKSPVEPEIAQHEKEMAKFLIGRFRRSRNITDAPTYTDTPTRAYRTFADRFLTNTSSNRLIGFSTSEFPNNVILKTLRKNRIFGSFKVTNSSSLFLIQKELFT